MNLKKETLIPLLLAVPMSISNGVSAFYTPLPHVSLSTKLMSTAATSDAQIDVIGASISKLKRVLEQEYITFFNPMVDSWYAQDVTFDDPMTSLSGVDSYRNNVDMLAGRTLLGKVLFDGAGINLHSVTGGGIKEGSGGEVEIENIITRWTLKVTAKVLPWKPEAVFSGISVCNVRPGGKEGMLFIICPCSLIWFDSAVSLIKRHLVSLCDPSYRSFNRWTN